MLIGLFAAPKHCLIKLLLLLLRTSTNGDYVVFNRCNNSRRRGHINGSRERRARTRIFKIRQSLNIQSTSSVRDGWHGAIDSMSHTFLDFTNLSMNDICASYLYVSFLFFPLPSAAEPDGGRVTLLLLL